ELTVLLEVGECRRRLVQIKIAQDSPVAVGRRIRGICSDRACVRLLRVLELAAEALGDAQLGPGGRAVRITRDCILEGFRRRIEVAILAMENPEIDERRGEL